MRKSKPLKKTSSVLSPEDTLQFLEDMRTLGDDIDEPSVAISIRIPNNLLRAVKAKAKCDGKKYQSLILQYLRQGLKTN